MDHCSADAEKVQMSTHMVGMSNSYGSPNHIHKYIYMYIERERERDRLLPQKKCSPERSRGLNPPAAKTYSSQHNNSPEAYVVSEKIPPNYRWLLL